MSNKVFLRLRKPDRPFMTKGKPYLLLSILVIMSSLLFTNCQNDTEATTYTDIPAKLSSDYSFAQERIHLKSSPSGALLSFMKLDNGQRNLWIANTQTLREMQLTDGLDITHMDWTFDDQLIISTQKNGSSKLFRVNPFDNGLTELQTPVASIVKMVGKSRHFPNQIAALVVATDQNKSGIYRVFLDGKSQSEKIADLEDFDSIYFNFPDKVKYRDRRMAVAPKNQA